MKHIRIERPSYSLSTLYSTELDHLITKTRFYINGHETYNPDMRQFLDYNNNIMKVFVSVIASAMADEDVEVQIV